PDEDKDHPTRRMLRDVAETRPTAEPHQAEGGRPDQRTEDIKEAETATRKAARTNHGWQDCTHPCDEASAQEHGETRAREPSVDPASSSSPSSTVSQNSDACNSTDLKPQLPPGEA